MSPASPVDARALLGSHWLFRSLDAGVRDRLIRHVRREGYAADQVIFRKGDRGRSMMAVARGRVKISTDALDGRRVVLGLIDAGEILGEIALLDGRERTADATAIEATDLLVLDRRDFMPVLERHPEVGLGLLSVLCDRLRRTSEQVEDLLFLVRPAKLAKVLLRLARQYGRAVPDGIRIELKLSQTELGSLTGMTRESANRQLADWREQGLIGIDDGGITIREIRQLERLVEQAR